MSRIRRRLLALSLAALVAGAAGAGGAGATTIPGDAVNMTGATSATIGFPTPQGNAYSPKLLAVGRSGAGQAEITWSGDFAFPHPLRFEDIGVAGQPSGSETTRQLRSGRYAYFCRFHGDSFGMSGVVYVAGPRASLSATPADIAPGESTRLDASSTDIVDFAAGAGAKYAFDPEGDGTFQPPGDATSMQVTYPVEGSFAARVRVTQAGRTDEAAFTIDVAPPGATPTPPPPDPPADSEPAGPAAESGPSAATPKIRRVTFADVAALPVFGRCVNRRRGVRIRVRDSAGGDVRSVRVLVNGRVAARRGSVRGRATLAVRPLPRGRPLVKVVITLAGGRKLTRSTRYRTCRGRPGAQRSGHARKSALRPAWEDATR